MTEQDRKSPIEKRFDLSDEERQARREAEGITDKGLAYDMALATDTDETRRANLELGAQALQEVQEDMTHLPPKGQSRKEKKLHELKRDRLLADHYAKVRFLEKRGLDHFSSGDLYDAPDVMERSRNPARWLAERAEDMTDSALISRERADALGAWVQALHKGVDPEYVQDHNNVDFSPSGMLRLEEESLNLQTDIDEIKSKLDKLTGLEAETGIEVWSVLRQVRLKTGITELIYEYEDETRQKELLKQWNQLVNNPSTTTLQSVANFYREVFENGLLKKLQSQAEQQLKVIEDVQTGRASESETLRHDRSDLS